MSIARPSRAWILVGLTLLAAVLRFWHLGRETLGFDEAMTWRNVTLPTLWDSARAEVNHGPLWWVVTRAFVAVFGDGEAALRAPACLAGTFAVPLTFLLAERLAPPTAERFRTALLAALLAAFGGFWIEFSQEARMYSTLLLVSIGLSLLLLDWLGTCRRRSLVAYAVVALVGLYTHVFTILPMLGHAAFVGIRALVRREPGAGRTVLGFALAQGLAVLGLVPWILNVLAHPVGLAASGRFDPLTRLGSALWRMVVGPAIAPYDAPRIAAGVAAFVASIWPILAVTGAIWVAAIGLGAIAVGRARGEALFLATGIVVPVGVLLLAQSRMPIMHEKYLIFLVPLLVTLAATGARNAPGLLRPVLTFLLLAVAIGSGLASPLRDVPLVARVLQQGHRSGKESYREVQRDFAARARADEIVVLSPGYLGPAWRYYDRGAHRTFGLERLPRDAADLRGLVPELAGAGRVTYVLAHDDSTGRAALLDVIAAESAIAPGRLREGVTLYPRQFGIRVLGVDRTRPISEK